MSKPWEQEWRVESGYMPSVNSSAADCVGGIIAEVVVNPKSAKTGDEVRGARLEAAQFLSAAPDMARALMAIRSRVAQAGDALPRPRNADEMAALEDSSITIPTEMLRAAFDALRKAGAL